MLCWHMYEYLLQNEYNFASNVMSDDNPFLAYLFSKWVHYCLYEKNIECIKQCLILLKN